MVQFRYDGRMLNLVSENGKHYPIGKNFHCRRLMQSEFVSQTIGHHMQLSHDVEVSKVGAGVDDGIGDPDDVQPGPDV